jgi:hypothetical protein
MSWIKSLYKETHEMWEQNGKDPKGYAIFYSPVAIKPKIVLIGYNPGGDESSFNEKKINVPAKHEYITGEYKMARNVKKIFEAADLKNELKNSVKFNLIFFRTKLAKDINNKMLIKFSEEKTFDVLERLQPENIIAEGFKTYERLKKLLFANNEKIIRYKERAILIRSMTSNYKNLIGILHPSGARGVSDLILEEIGKNLKNIIK